MQTEKNRADEKKIEEEVAPRCKKRQFVSKNDLSILYKWKSPRIAHYCAKNKADFIQAVTRTALTTENGRLRIEVLCLLQGTAWPVASAILHWCHPDPYPILDFRALWSLGVDRDKMKVYDYDFWLGYNKYCRELSKETGCSMRDIDRALWAYSKEK